MRGKRIDNLESHPVVVSMSFAAWRRPGTGTSGWLRRGEEPLSDGPIDVLTMPTADYLGSYPARRSR